MYDAMGPYYDLIHRAAEAEDRGETVGFLRWVFDEIAQRTVEDVLDCGAGTGRIALPLAKAGYRVTALEQSATLLEGLRTRLGGREGCTLIEGRAENIDEQETQDAILCVYSVFQHLLEDTDVERALEAWRNALRPGGVLIFDVANALHWLGNFDAHPSTHHADGDVTLIRHVTLSVDDVTCTLWHDEAGMAHDQGRWHSYHERIPMRLYTANEVLRLLRDAHFREVRLFRGYGDRGEATGNTARLVFTAVKP